MKKKYKIKNKLDTMLDRLNAMGATVTVVGGAIKTIEIDEKDKLKVERITGYLVEE